MKEKAIPNILLNNHFYFLNKNILNLTIENTKKVIENVIIYTIKL